MIKRCMALAFLLISIAAGATGGASRAHAQDAVGPLQSLLMQIPDNDISRTALWYGSIHDLELILGINLSAADDISKLTEAQQVAYLSDVGNQVYYSPYLGLDKPLAWQQSFAIDPFKVERELTVGDAPNRYGLLAGTFDKPAIIAALATLGYQSTTMNGKTVYGSGADNSPAQGSPAAENFNRLYISDRTIIATASTAVLEKSIASGPTLADDPAYASLVTLMEGADTVPGTLLLSAVLFNGPYLSDILITADPLKSAEGTTLSADQIEQLRAQLGLKDEKLLPRYQVAGLGYRRSAAERYWLIGLVYADAASAKSAIAILTDHLTRYVSFVQAGRKLFDGWKIDSRLSTAPDGKHTITLLTMKMPADQTDVSWTKLIAVRDIGFLATEH